MSRWKAGVFLGCFPLRDKKSVLKQPSGLLVNLCNSLGYSIRFINSTNKLLTTSIIKTSIHLNQNLLQNYEKRLDENKGKIEI